MEVEFRGRKKITKFDSLKPLLTLLESTLVTHGLDQRAADMVVLDIAERLVTAGYGWDKVLQYQAKVSSRGHLDNVDIFSSNIIKETIRVCVCVRSVISFFVRSSHFTSK